jgi:hypothetical protein
MFNMLTYHYLSCSTVLICVLLCYQMCFLYAIYSWLWFITTLVKLNWMEPSSENIMSFHIQLHTRFLLFLAVVMHLDCIHMYTTLQSLLTAFAILQWGILIWQYVIVLIVTMHIIFIFPDFPNQCLSNTCSEPVKTYLSPNFSTNIINISTSDYKFSVFRQSIHVISPVSSWLITYCSISNKGSVIWLYYNQSAMYHNL